MCARFQPLAPSVEGTPEKGPLSPVEKYHETAQMIPSTVPSTEERRKMQPLTLPIEINATPVNDGKIMFPKIGLGAGSHTSMAWSSGTDSELESLHKATATGDLSSHFKDNENDHNLYLGIFLNVPFQIDLLNSCTTDLSIPFQQTFKDQEWFFFPLAKWSQGCFWLAVPGKE